MFSWKKKKKHSPSASAPASGLTSSQVTRQLPVQFLINSQSQSQQEKQQSQPICPWSAHAPPFGQSRSPFLRDSHSLSTSATAAGELFLFGGYAQNTNLKNDLYVISTRDFSVTLLETSGDVPSPRYGQCVVLTSTILLIWGGSPRGEIIDDSFYLLNLGTLDLKTRFS
jgi:hypothetical protein